MYNNHYSTIINTQNKHAAHIIGKLLRTCLARNVLGASFRARADTILFMVGSPLQRGLALRNQLHTRTHARKPGYGCDAMCIACGGFEDARLRYPSETVLVVCASSLAWFLERRQNNMKYPPSVVVCWSWLFCKINNTSLGIFCVYYNLYVLHILSRLLRLSKHLSQRLHVQFLLNQQQ